MDVSDCTPGVIVATVHLTLVCSLLGMLWMGYGLGAELFFGHWLGWMLIVVFVVLPVLVILTAVFTEPREPVRFNRQRREVCVPGRKGEQYWYVPWEMVKASAEGFNTVSQAGVNMNGSLMIGFPNPDFNGEVKLGGNGFSSNVYFPNVVPTVGAGMWELIRTYMEEGPEHLKVETEHFTAQKEGIIERYIKDVKASIAKRGRFKAFLWDGIFGLIMCNILLVDYINRRHLSPPPDLKGDRVKQWSKPLPKEQWAKRSAELEQAIREREAELARQTAA
ncbi:DUF6708 domain-containing protein [Oceanimonas smirnovii]|uniref:DUF6708 domain-containing protein n=1 Tax=Oceanimonas smirnovii TaxID=264574 RepID=UPI001FE1DB8C|nr:DUF6708 domain-containing protein [Oceanimonas smirnovii]